MVIRSWGGRGKVTGAHDGIAYYYRELPADRNFTLSADVEVLRFCQKNLAGQAVSNGQESFGIMARDVIGEQGSTEVFASNIAAAGAIKRGLHGFIREGVSKALGEGAGAGAAMVLLPPEPRFLTTTYPNIADYPPFPAEGRKLRLTLRKTNTGYHSTVDDGSGRAEEYTFYRPQLLSQIDADRFYVGFYAARWAEIRVTNIRYAETAAVEDPPGEVEPSSLVAPSAAFASPSFHGGTEGYTAEVRTNAPGSVLLAINGRPAAEALEVEFYPDRGWGSVLVRDLDLEPGINRLEAVFTPVQDGRLSSLEPARSALAVESRTYGLPGDTIYVSPRGSPRGTGDHGSPLDLATALAYLQAGQRIILEDGIYPLSEALIIPRHNDGREGARKALIARNSGKAVMDFGRRPVTAGFVLAGSRWRIQGIVVRNTPDKVKGFQISGSGNIVEDCVVYGCGDTGMQISGSSLEPRSFWPSENLILNCGSHDNMDAAEIDADGFAAKLTVGEGNVFRGCVSRNNCDDGWDLYTKLETGPIGAVVLENCVSYGNGTLSNGYVTRAGKNGFKLGGEGIPVPHAIVRCVAYGNGAEGFTSNSNPAVRIFSSAAYDNGGRNFSFSVYPTGKPAFQVRDLRSLRSGPGPADGPLRPGMAAPLNYFWDGTRSVDGDGRVLAGQPALPAKPGTGGFPRGRDSMPDISPFFGSAPRP